MAIRPKQIDTLMDKASKTLAATEYFKAETLAEQALKLARQAEDFERMARIILPLQETRRQRLQMALDVGTITILEEPVGEDTKVESGCYLVRPPLVGADARRLRLAALHQEVPVAVVCREPLTDLKLCPIVAIGPGVTVRTKVKPPKKPDAPTMAWFTMALETLGDFAIETIDPGVAALKRLDILIARLDAIPDHEGLHHAVAEACAAAEAEARDGTGKSRRNARSSADA
ncbi:MAG: hypothetical protein HKO59_11020 [Phycisphaerales bacterium]|nr:hypothetical protein [Phycisphaerae bacterium]NNF44086.1 hypothetical protein [Phycisphaerales bacterium]NNM26495.1 hypothetical protein [Phycisphaerales bacterium]